MSKQSQKILYGYSLFTFCSFDSTNDILVCYRGKYCIERFYKDLKDHATKIINYEKKETDQEYKSYKKKKVCYLCKKGFITDDDSKKYHKVRDHFYFVG